MSKDKLINWIVESQEKVEKTKNNLDLLSPDSSKQYCFCKGSFSVLSILLEKINNGEFDEVNNKEERLLNYFVLKSNDINNKISNSNDKFETMGYMNQLNLLNEIIDELGLKEGMNNEFKRIS